MLDVARRPFHLDFLKDLVKTMSWYKLNNFHVHLNDNCFGKLEDGKTPDYSGFRLESDVPNLTSTDYYYTKDEFRSFILDSRKVGVDSHRNSIRQDTLVHLSAQDRIWLVPTAMNILMSKIRKRSNSSRAYLRNI